MTHYQIQGGTLSGRITAPPSKSHTLRALLFASMAKGKSHLLGYLNSPDTLAMVEACRKLGAQITSSETTMEITGVAGKPRLPDDVIHAGNSGQVLRFIAAIAALTDGYTVLTGDHSIRYNRPVKPLMDALSKLGATCLSTKSDEYAPIIVKGPITSGKTRLNGEDSQPVSALLMASAFLKGTTEIRVDHSGETPWVALTLDWFDRLGIVYHHENFEYYRVEGGREIRAFEYIVPSDFSSIAYPIVAALVTRSEIIIDNVDMQEIQGDKKVIEVLRRMGANLVEKDNSLLVQPSHALQGCTIDVNPFIDALPILAVVGCYAKGHTHLVNAGIARKKESDRLATITSELNKMGARITETEESLLIEGSPLHNAQVNSHNDHRIAMSLAVAALGITQPSTITDVDCITKSYPNFPNAMQALGCSIHTVQ